MPRAIPNLLDDDWLWGGTLDEIAFTVTHGIRNEQSPDTHWSQMPAFGEILTPEEIDGGRAARARHLQSGA